MNTPRTWRATATRQGMAVAVLLGSAFTASAAPDDRTVDTISRYCTACWRNARLPADAWGDCTQEVFIRLLRTIPPGQWAQTLNAEGDERRELVRAIDATKKRVQRGRQFQPVDDVAARPAAADHFDREAFDRATNDVLSGRQQEIVRLTRDGWTVPEIAGELNTTPERISDEKYKAIRKLQKHFGVVA